MKMIETPCPRCGGTLLKPARGGLRRIRESRGLSLRWMARYLGYSPSYISDVEHGRRGVTQRVLKAYQRWEHAGREGT